MSTRKSFQKPGFDCIRGPCPHKPKREGPLHGREHGINGGSWWFVVTDGPVAVSLEVLTSFYPETVPPRARDTGWPARRDQVTGQVTWHRATPTDQDTEGRRCEFVPGGKCYDANVGFLIADEFAPLLGDTFENQPERLWARLEALAVEFRREVES